MKHDVFHHFERDPDAARRHQEVVGMLRTINIKLERLMATMTELNAAVARNTNASDSVLVLLRGISQQLKDAKATGDPAAIDAVIVQLDANTEKAAAAVVANTDRAAQPAPSQGR